MPPTEQWLIYRVSQWRASKSTFLVHSWSRYQICLILLEASETLDLVQWLVFIRSPAHCIWEVHGLDLIFGLKILQWAHFNVWLFMNWSLQWRRGVVYSRKYFALFYRSLALLSLSASLRGRITARKIDAADCWLDSCKGAWWMDPQGDHYYIVDIRATTTSVCSQPHFDAIASGRGLYVIESVFTRFCLSIFLFCTVVFLPQHQVNSMQHSYLIFLIDGIWATMLCVSVLLDLQTLYKMPRNNACIPSSNKNKYWMWLTNNNDIFYTRSQLKVE
jgi:hypothetical protein